MGETGLILEQKTKWRPQIAPDQGYGSFGNATFVMLGNEYEAGSTVEPSTGMPSYAPFMCIDRTPYLWFCSGDVGVGAYWRFEPQTAELARMFASSPWYKGVPCSRDCGEFNEFAGAPGFPTIFGQVL